MLSLFLALGVIGVMVLWLMFAKGFNYILIQLGSTAVANYVKGHALLPVLAFLPAVFVMFVFFGPVAGLATPASIMPRYFLDRFFRSSDPR